MGRVQEGSQGWGQPRGGHEHTGKPPGQGFKQDREGRGGWIAERPGGVASRGEAGEEARAGSWWGGDSGLGYEVAVEVSIFELF